MLTDEHFAFLAEKYMDMIFRLAFSYTKNAADADDVTQEVLLAFCRTDKDFETEEHVKHWLIRVTINRCRKLFRAPWRRCENLEDYAESLAFEKEEYAELFTAVMELERKYRLPIHLHYFHGYSVSEIAELLDENVNTVKTRLARGRAALKTKLTEAEIS